MKFEVIDGYLVAVGKPKANALASLDASIQKWETILAWVKEHNEIPNNGDAGTCGCCITFLDSECHDCPIYQLTGNDQCGGTPYQEYTRLEYDSRYDDQDDIAPYIPDAILAAQREIAFLKAVRAWWVAQAKLRSKAMKYVSE